MPDATVIPFPRTAPAGGQERLRRAMERLQAALGAQREALSDWHFAMTELGVGMAGLSHALACYQDSLSGTESELTSLRAESAGLAASVGCHRASRPSAAS